MNHEEALQLLEDYVDGRLDPEIRDRVETHVAGCDVCRSILGGVDSVDLTALGRGDVDDRTLRRSVRRALWRTVVEAAGMLLLLGAAFVAIAILVIQPILMNRGGRAAAMARATFDVVGMFNEGAIVGDFTIRSGAFDRTFTAQVQMPVGDGMVDLGTVSSRVGILGVGTIQPMTGSESRRAGSARDVLSRLGRGAVATVAVGFEAPMSVDEAQTLAVSPGADVSVVWAGFLLTEADPAVAAQDPLGMLGYSTCVGTDHIPAALFSASSASTSQSLGPDAPSVRRALEEVRRGVAHLAAHPGVAARLLDGGVEESVQRANTYLTQTDPRVETLVVTGPADQVLDFVDQSGAAGGVVLAVDFYNWSHPACGS